MRAERNTKLVFIPEATICFNACVILKASGVSDANHHTNRICTRQVPAQN